jgi:16S rRNA (cytosine967-C5)-methyltransferase
MSVNARQTALGVLAEVADNGAYLNLSLKKHLPSLKTPEDRRFCAALVSTAVQNIIRIDYVLNQFVTAKRVHKVIQNILRLGVCQLMFFESVPQSAAVNESVKLASHSAKAQLKGFVNGVLRNVSQNLGSITYPDAERQPALHLSVLYSYPLWLCEQFIGDYGFDFTASLLSCSADTTLTCVRLEREENWSPEDTAFLESFLPGKYCANARYIKNAGSIENMPLYQKGLITPQGESSVLCVQAAGIKNTDAVLDVCAAPGGKSAYAASLCKSLVSMDLHPHRVDLIRSTFARLHIKNAEALCADGTVFQPALLEAFDLVLIDAPCSALGLLYRKPDIKLHAKKEGAAELVQIQRALLENCSRYVKPGGCLVYSTCTINPEENAQNAAWFLANHPEFAPDDFSSTMPQALADKVKNGCLHLFPNTDGVDGFFIARFRRNG